jgi:hypothetical protein
MRKGSSFKPELFNLLKFILNENKKLSRCMCYCFLSGPSQLSILNSLGSGCESIIWKVLTLCLIITGCKPIVKQIFFALVKLTTPEDVGGFSAKLAVVSKVLHYPHLVYYTGSAQRLL